MELNNSKASDAPSGASRKFYYVYILRSVGDNWIYVGYSANLKQRFSDHNLGRSQSTSRHRPFELIHYEAYSNMRDAKRREMYLKTTKGKTTLRAMLIEFLTCKTT